jgi:hypothetical protein
MTWLARLLGPAIFNYIKALVAKKALSLAVAKVKVWLKNKSKTKTK